MRAIADNFHIVKKVIYCG